MKYIIKHVTVDALWGVKSLDSDFYKDINILIGQNGSNKTTFINLIEGCLMVERHALIQIPFKRVVFQLINNENCYENLIIEHIREKNREIARYYIPEEGIVDLILIDEEHSLGRLLDRNNHIRIVNALHRMVDISWLSVDRYNDFTEDSRRNYDEPHRTMRYVVDFKLAELLKDLTVYRLRLVEQTNKLTTELNQEVLSLLLFDDETDNFDIIRLDRFSALDINEIEISLKRVFQQMGNMRKMENRIQLHIAKLMEAIGRLKLQERLTLNDVAAIVLINRTLTIIDLSKKYKENVDRIMEPITTYMSKLQKFIKDKIFNFSEETGALEIVWSGKILDGPVATKLSPSRLSSGEKQLLILLTQTLLQENRPYIFIADEPELSLHIEWQRNIIGAIHEMNPNAQIVVATHSPEIAGQWANKIITMESITSYENRK